MARAYSADLRIRIVEDYTTGNLTQSELAKRYRVSLSSVKRYLVLKNKTGKIDPHPFRGGRPPLISEEGYQTLAKAIQEKSTISLADLSLLYKEHHHKKINISVLSRACIKLRLFRKKLSIHAVEREREDIKKKN